MRKTALIAVLLAATIIVTAHNSPKAHAESAKTNQQPTPKTVVVQHGDNLSKIAKAQDSTYQRIYDANPQISDPDLIYPGDMLRIPTAEEQLVSRVVQKASPPAPVAQKAKLARTTTVKSKQVAKAAPAIADGSEWDRLAQCEAGGNWSTDTGNGYSGGLQFSPGSWSGVGGTGSPSQASREEQIARGQMLQARSGWGAWPACSTKLGLR